MCIRDRDKLRPLSDQECMDLIRKVQAEYRLPEKARTIGELSLIHIYSVEVRELLLVVRLGQILGIDPVDADMGVERDVYKRQSLSSEVTSSP